MALAAKKELLLHLVLKELILNNNKLTSLPPSKCSNYDSTCIVHVVHPVRGTANLQIVTLQYNFLSELPHIENGASLKVNSHIVCVH